MKQIQFGIADFGPIEGFTDGSTWNGWLNVWVTPEVHAQMCVHLADMDDGADFCSLMPDPRGLISLNGYCTEQWNHQIA